MGGTWSQQMRARVRQKSWQLSWSEFDEWAKQLGEELSCEGVERRYGKCWFHLSEKVSVEIDTAVTRKGTIRRDLRGDGRPPVQVCLWSRATKKVLDRKAQGQRGFHHTLGWKENWGRGVRRAVVAYQRRREFYERIACEDKSDAAHARQVAADNEVTRWKHIVQRRCIEGIPEWQSSGFLVSLHESMQRYPHSVLTDKQFACVVTMYRERVGQRPLFETLVSAPEPVRYRVQEYVEGFMGLSESTRAFLRSSRAEREEKQARPVTWNTKTGNETAEVCDGTASATAGEDETSEEGCGESKGCGGAA